MSVCTGIGNGIGGALGKWGVGSALGLGFTVDAAARAYTGYGLIEMLNVPYIECEDGSFATAIEWYGSGLKCSQKKETTPTASPQPSQKGAAKKYDDIIGLLGGATYTYFGSHGVGKIGTFSSEAMPGHYGAEPKLIDKCGNILSSGYVSSGDGSGYVSGYGRDGEYEFTNYGWAGWSSLSYPAGITTKEAGDPDINFPYLSPWSVIGIRADLPSQLPKAAPAAKLPPPAAFIPASSNNLPNNCEMACPCLTPADIEKAVKKALGLSPFAPEKLIREFGAKIYAAPGPSVVPVVPANLVEAIAAMAAAIYMRAGYGRYPVVMPNSLIASDNPTGDAVPTNSLENFAEWFEWFIKQQDAVQGEWPIDIAIVDGAKRQPLKFENMSEAFAELTGLVIQTAADADTAVNAACTAAGIAQKAVNAATIGQKNIECLIQCFGFRTGFKALFVQSAITPADPDDKNFNVRKFLSPSSQNLAVLTDNDPFDFQATLDRILRNTEISRASVARSVDKDGLPGDFARNQRKYDAAEARRDTEKAMEKLETSIKAQNPTMDFKIKVGGTPTDVISGDNFVIKRPKTE